MVLKKLHEMVLRQLSMMTVVLCWICVGVAGCTTVTVQPSPPLDAQAAWVILPMLNNAQSPQAGQRVESILAALLRAKGVVKLDTYSSSGEGEALSELDDRQLYEKALEWAQSRHYRYGVAGSVEEWHYKSGAEGVPAVGLTISVVDVASGRVVWSATGAQTGWGRDALTAVAQRLLKKFLDGLEITEGQLSHVKEG